MSESKALINIAADPSRSLAFVETIGERIVLAMKGVKSKPIATVVALQMLCEGLSPLEFERKYHVLDGGGFAHRAEWIHAEMLNRGWSVEWDKDGEDGKEASAKFSLNGGKETVVSFSLEMAKKKGLLRSGSQWTNDPAIMLRSRVITRAATMLEPGIGAGLADDDEARRSSPIDSSEVTSSVVSASAASPPLAASSASTKQTEQPKSTESKPASEQPASKAITLQSMASALDLPSRAFTSFNFVSDDCEKITTIADIVKHTYDELLSRDKLGKGTLDKIVVELKKHGFDLALHSPANRSGSGSASEAESVPPEASTDAAALAARGLELAEDSDANHTDNEHGAAIAEIREICTDAKLKETAKAVMGERCGGKSSLADLSHLETQIVLVYLLAIQCGIPVEKIDAVCDKINSDSDPVARATINITDLKKRLGKN